MTEPKPLPLLPEELERTSVQDALTADQMQSLLWRARSEPEIWTIALVMPRTPGGVSTRTFSHKPSGRQYTFTHVQGQNSWHRVAGPEQP